MSAECNICGSHLVQRNTGTDMKFLCPLCEWTKAEASAARGWVEAEKLAKALDNARAEHAGGGAECRHYGGIRKPGKCNCGADEENAKINAILAAFEVAKKETPRG